MRTTALVWCTCCLAAASAARAEIVRLRRVGMLGQTTLYRGKVTLSGGGWITRIVLADLNREGGSGGVLSGFDCDFILFDQDNDMTTTADWRLPVLAQTHLVPGKADYPSKFRPTALHPGPLFGLRPDGEIDAPTATLRRRDAHYQAGNVTVNTCGGFLSLGDRGRLVVGFVPFWVGSADTAYLLVGDAGEADELVAFSVGLASFPPVADPAGPYGPERWEGDHVTLEGGESFGDSTIVSWGWDLTGDGEPDLLGPAPVVTQEQAAELGLTGGRWHDVTLTVTTHRGDVGSTTTQLWVVPEPAAILLVAAGAPWVLRRRVRAA